MYYKKKIKNTHNHENLPSLQIRIQCEQSKSKLTMCRFFKAKVKTDLFSF